MRQWLIDKRERQGLNRDQMAEKCRCSKGLLRLLEDEDIITHQDIASRIALEYDLTPEEYNCIVHEDRRVKCMPNAKEPPTLAEFFASKYARQKRYKNKQR